MAWRDEPFMGGGGEPCAKTAYSTKQAAQADAKKLKKKQPWRRFRTYNTCDDHPGQWHVTHLRNKAVLW
jgi:hypothetical protein